MAESPASPRRNSCKFRLFCSCSAHSFMKSRGKCMALWSEDGQCQEAEVEETDEENGAAAVTFAGCGDADKKEGRQRRTVAANPRPAEEECCVFASPESVTGKVGVGTCGIAGTTQYQGASKYNVSLPCFPPLPNPRHLKSVPPSLRQCLGV
ncbi:hypothetical protein QTO34_007822 [Cnephaeus nilssonii]|uniref:Uncharacterized protein n=1 Tax=Cnephaeus nilssonii TaxID=3371016 RepID=A0AA40HK53_CNENI|nr:hypothetical protein QTO34_007822 [Eptesicus nilssonii]